MKIYIVTVYNSLNPGSFLQATSLYKSIERMGYDVAFLDTGARSILKQTCKEVFFLLAKLKLTAVFGKLKSGLGFYKALKEYKVEKNSGSEGAVYILGSDEIWNVRRKNMADYSVFWGEGLPQERCLSFSPSLNNADIDELNKHTYVKAALERLHSISVRDMYSKEVLSKLTDREILITCDPTVLREKSEFEQLENQCPDFGYILIYIYPNKVSDKEIEAIKAFAKKKNKKLISFGGTHSWCDKNVKGTAYDFISYISHADYVCTSTFHGTMLSIIYNKQFAVFGNSNRKVHELLDFFDLPRSANESNADQILSGKYDCNKVNQKLREQRIKAIDYLSNSIQEIEKL